MNKLNKLPKISLILMIFFSTIFGNDSKVEAATYQPVNLGSIAGTGAEVRQGYNTAWWRDGVGKISVNGEIAFCIEPTTLGLGGSYSKNDDIPFDLKDKLSLITYYGWDSTSKTDDDYATTQYMIWEALGASITQWYGNFGSRYQNLKANVQAKINTHGVLPNFGSENHNVDVGNSLTLNDKNNVLNNYHITSNGGSSVSINGNSMIITPNINTPENLRIEFSRILDECLGASIAYRSSSDSGQDVGVFKVGDPYTVSVSIKVNKFGNLNISKQDEDGTYIPNTSFSLSYNADMSSPIGTYTTGADGKILVEQLLPKKVYVQEVAVPEPLILDSTIHEVTIIPNDTVPYNASNIYKTGNLEIKKLDADTGKPVETVGAEFEVYKSDGTYVNTISTNGKGVASLTGIRWGDYYFIEKTAPNKYTSSNERVNFSIRDNGVTIAKSFSNKRTLGTIQLKKIDKETGETAQGDATLEGAVYILKAKEDILSPDDHHVIHKAGTDLNTLVIKDGTAKVENLYLGKYELIEKTPSNGYLLDESAHEISLNYTDQTKTVEIRDVLSSEQVMKRAFQIIKVSSDGEAGSTPVLKGAHFVVKLESEVQKVGWENAKSYDELVTDDKGYAKSIELPYGKYRVKETVVPADHSPVADFFVNITNDSREPLKWTVQNDMPYKTYIGIVKTDTETGNIVRLPGATFKIKNLDTNDYVGFWVYGDPTVKWVDEFVTNEDGNLITPGTVRAGRYQIEEIKAPNGMVLNRESLPFVLSEGGAQQIGPDGSSYITTFQFSNSPSKGKLVIEKTAELFTGFEEVKTDYGTLHKAKFENGLLGGVTYEIRAREDIKSADGTEIYYHKGQLVETLKTDGKSSTKSSLLPLGKYTLQETECEDDGYVIDSKEYDFDFVYKDQTTEVVFQTMKPINDKQRASATIDKQLEDSEVIDNTSIHSNIKFGVFTDSELTVNGKKVLDKDKLIQVVSLNDTLKGNIMLDFASNYYLKEIATDNQYILNGEKIPFNFAYAGNKETVIEINGGKPIENKVKRGEIKILKTDADSGNPVAGAVFELSRDKDFNNVFMTLTSGADGYAIAEGVEKSTIYVREKTAPDGYAGNKKTEKVEIVENGQIVELSYSNEAYHGYITVHKTEKETNDDLSGIVYKVIADEDIYAIGQPRDADGNKIIAYHKGDVVTTANAVDGCYMTDETGSIFIGGETGLPLGRYAIFEVKTLETHVLDPLKHIVTISPDSDTKGIIKRELNTENDFIKINISKLDSFTKEYVVGAKLQLINKLTGKVAYEWISGDAGQRFDRVPAGNYILHEASIPENSGYVTAEDIEITVEARTDLQNFTLEDDHTKFDISKTDMVTGEEIHGATLQLLDEKGNVIEEWVTNGEPHRIEYLQPNKTYILHEEYVAYGYAYAEDIKFTVEDTGEIQKINMKDEKIYSYINVKKVDSKDHEKVLEGAEFTLYADEDCTKELSKAYTDKQGIALFDNLSYQTVYIKETKAPAGYNLSDDIAKVTVDDEWVKGSKTITFANHIIEPITPVDTGMQSNSYLVALLLGSLVAITFTLKRRKSKK